MVESAVTAAPTESLADVRRVSPAAHLAEQFAAAEVTGARAVRISEVAFLTMVGVRSAPGSAATARIETRLGAAAAHRLWVRHHRRRGLGAVVVTGRVPRGRRRAAGSADVEAGRSARG